MEVLFVASLCCLLGTLILKHIESHVGARYAVRVRERLDTTCMNVFEHIRYGAHRAGEYIKRDMFMRGLHSLTYLALVSVRLVERKLVFVASMLRSLRRPREGGVRESRWSRVQREGVRREA